MGCSKPWFSWVTTAQVDCPTIVNLNRCIKFPKQHHHACFTRTKNSNTPPKWQWCRRGWTRTAGHGLEEDCTRHVVWPFGSLTHSWPWKGKLFLLGFSPVRGSRRFWCIFLCHRWTFHFESGWVNWRNWNLGDFFFIKKKWWKELSYRMHQTCPNLGKSDAKFVAILAKADQSHAHSDRPGDLASKLG